MTDSNTVIEGTVKFRDGKKWKSRWCVMRKLSPVADCLHLQLYRDSKDRYKHGQTKASLSLQHFLGVESGFTLDKESNTIAIICQDVTVVLAFDTRERLIQWQVKISSNLGDDQQFLIQIASCPPKSKIATGPARLHVQDLRFSMTTGVPPRLVGVWELRHLRKYGVIESRFCFEGGSRCGKGEGLFVCFTDQGDDITRCMNLAAESKLATRKRFLTRNMSVLESPSRRGLLSRLDSRASEYGGDHQSFNQHTHERNNEDNMCWPSNESRLDNSDFGDTASVGDFQDQILQECTWVPESTIERCASCISKLGALSRSSTMANTPGTKGFNPAWTMDNNVSSLNYIPEMSNDHRCCGCVSSLSSSSGGSAGCSSVCGTEYSVPRKVCNSANDEMKKSQPEVRNVPNRPPKPVHLKPETSTPVKKAPMPLPPMPLPPMPLPQQDTTCVCRCATASDKPRQSNLNNYDPPKTVQCANTKQNKQYPCVQDEYYDTPRNIKSVLEVNPYGNYDTPPSPVAVHKKSNASCPPKQPDTTRFSGICPCQIAMNCWSHNWMTMPSQCRQNNNIIINKTSNNPTPLGGRQSPNGAAVYATVDVSKKKKHAAEPARHPAPAPAGASSNYMNLEPVAEVPAADAGLQRTADKNYTNLEFSESLCLYENAKSVLAKAGGQQRVGGNACDNCGRHQKPRCENGSGGGERTGGGGGDYMTMEPVNGRMRPTEEAKRNLFPGYLPMCPAGGGGKQRVTLKNVEGLAEKSASIPSLNDGDGGSVPVQYFRNKNLQCASDDEPRKRSSSAGSSARYESDVPPRPQLASSGTPSGDAAAGVDPRSAAIGSDDASSADSAYSCSGGRTRPGCCSSGARSDDGGFRLADAALVHIRRSSSVPCKNNRDSSSSNDSGVSTGSLRYRGGDFAEFELPLTTAMSAMRHKRTVQTAAVSRHCGGAALPGGCVHGSLPRRSKSTDRLEELGFGSRKSAAGPVKSSSAGAEVPVCFKKEKAAGYNADGTTGAPFLDSQSTSSYTSDMSDYIETLSLSSHSSSDTNNENLRFSRTAKTTLKPRSGKEYHQIGYFLDGDLKVKSSIPPVPEKSETPSPRYTAAAQESHVA